MTTTNFHDLLDQALAGGEVVKTQTKKTQGSDAYAHFDFVGGTFGGQRLRLYPPFGPFTHRHETWVLEPQYKNGKQVRSIYRLQQEES